MDKIDTFLLFKSEVVEKDLCDFLADKKDLRKAFHIAVSLFHLADWVYVAKQSDIRKRYTLKDEKKQKEKAFYDALGEEHPEFQSIRDIANAVKHLENAYDLMIRSTGEIDQWPPARTVSGSVVAGGR